MIGLASQTTGREEAGELTGCPPRLPLITSNGQEKEHGTADTDRTGGDRTLHGIGCPPASSSEPSWLSQLAASSRRTGDRLGKPAGVANTLDVPGDIWMVDLPGDGSNIAAPGASSDPFEKWPQVLIEVAQELPAELPATVYIGHSTGGMYLLSTPELEAHLSGLVLISTAPDASWLSAFIASTLTAARLVTVP